MYILSAYKKKEIKMKLRAFNSADYGYFECCILAFLVSYKFL